MDCHAGFLSGRLISSNEETWVLFHHDYPYAVPRTLFQCVCTQRRNCIGQLSPFSEYAPTAQQGETAAVRINSRPDARNRECRPRV